MKNNSSDPYNIYYANSKAYALKFINFFFHKCFCVYTKMVNNYFCVYIYKIVNKYYQKKTKNSFEKKHVKGTESF